MEWAKDLAMDCYDIIAASLLKNQIVCACFMCSAQPSRCHLVPAQCNVPAPRTPRTPTPYDEIDHPPLSSPTACERHHRFTTFTTEAEAKGGQGIKRREKEQQMGQARVPHLDGDSDTFGDLIWMVTVFHG